VVVIVATLCVINLFLWFLFFNKFTKLFSTDDVIARTRSELDQMIRDVNNNASRNITILEDRIKQLRDIINEADRHVNVARSELQKQQEQYLYSQTVESALKQSSRQPQPAGGASGKMARAVRKYKQNAVFSQSDLFQESAAVPGTPVSLSAGFPAEPSADIPAEASGGTAASQPLHVAADGTTYKTVPVIGPAVYVSDNPVKVKKTFAAQVQELYDRGQTVEEIATALNSSITEVQFVVDMSLEE